MLTARFLAMPVIALTVIVALAQAHSRPGTSQTETRTVYRAVNCATAVATDAIPADKFAIPADYKTKIEK